MISVLNTDAMLETLHEQLATADETRLAIAFASQDGLELLRPALEKALQQGSGIEIIVGLDGTVTDGAVVATLYGYMEHHANFGLWCHASSRSRLFHPKFYGFKAGDYATCIIGSSNLTRGGLQNNVELNLLVSGALADEAIADLYNAYELFRFSSDVVRPDAELVALYHDLSTQHKARRPRPDETIRELNQALETHVSHLSQPKAPPVLRGWAKLVYEVLPDGEFTTEAIYDHVELFRQQYPTNQHIEAKIRQQLQNLRDAGLLEHPRQGLWRKTLY